MKSLKHNSWEILFIMYVNINQIFCGTVSSIQIEGSQAAEAKLYHKLLSSYNKRVRPVLNSEDLVEVNVSITLANVLAIDEKHQSLSTLLWIFTAWIDPFLSWNQTEFPESNYFVIQLDEIWSPDLIVYNTLGNTVPIFREYLGRAESIRVSSSGNVRHAYPLLLKSYCPMSIELFPFDSHHCPITLASWAYISSELKLSTMKYVAVLGTTQWDVSKNWIVQKFTGRKSVINYSGNIIGNISYDQMEFSITLNRKSTFYVFNLLVPCYLISIISCLCYAIPPQGGDRINLLLTTFLSIVVFVLVVLEIMPEESNALPLFTQFLLMVMLLNMFQLFYCTFVCGLYHMDEIFCGPPKCLVTWAEMRTICKISSNQESSNCNKSEQDSLQQVDLKCSTVPHVGFEMASSHIVNPGNIQGNADKEINIEKSAAKEDMEAVADTNSKTDGVTDENKGNIKEWRAVMKAMDIVLFLLNFLGLTGYFMAILLIYN